ncbi:MAG: hypothetical protein AB1772_09945 [Candidatus Zixiibacteriota bacterium]
MLARTAIPLVYLLVVVGATALFITGCGEEAAQTPPPADTAAVTADTAPISQTRLYQAVVDLPPDGTESLRRKRAEILSWTPKQADKIDFALKGVRRIVRLADLGLGDTVSFAAPRMPSSGWPIAHSVRLNLGREITALVTRFKLDTLPGPRVRGEGYLSLVGLHCDTTYGEYIELPRTGSGPGRFELVFLSNHLFVQLNCCGLPPTIGMARYGDVSDTLTLIYTFDPSRAGYSITLIGPEHGRTYPGFDYGLFRTERGEFHRDLQEFPYLCRARDSSYVNLVIGSRFRGRKSQLEPVLSVKMF